MGLGSACDPMKHEVSGWYQNDIAGVGIERILARSQRPFPNASLSLCYTFAVAECLSGKIAADSADVADDDPDKTDWDHRLGHRFHGCEPPVDEIRAVSEGNVLP